MPVFDRNSRVSALRPCFAASSLQAHDDSKHAVDKASGYDAPPGRELYRIVPSLIDPFK